MKKIYKKTEDFIIIKNLSSSDIVVQFFEHPEPDDFDKIWDYIYPETDTIYLTIFYPLDKKKEEDIPIDEEYVLNSIDYSTKWTYKEEEYETDGVREIIYEIRPSEVVLKSQKEEKGLMVKEFEIVLEYEYVDDDFVSIDDLRNPW